MQFKKYLKQLVSEQASGTEQRSVKSKDVMPLISSAELTDGEGDGKMGEDFDLDDDAKITVGKQKEDQKQQGNKSSGKDPIKGDLLKIVDQLAKKQEKLDQHVKDGKAIKVIKVPKGPNAPDYLPSFPDNPQSEIERKLSETEEHLEQTNNRGVGIGGNRSTGGQLYKTKTNWRALLRNTASKIEDIKRTYAKIHKRMFAANIQLPGKVKDESGVDMIFALDTSGSIGDQTLSIFISEIFKVAKEFEGEATMRILLWHSEVYLDCKVSKEYSPSQIVSAVRRLPAQSGGTTLSSINDYFTKEKLDVDVPEALYLIVLTDGFVESDAVMPKQILKENRIFLVIEGGSLNAVKALGGKSLFIDVYR
jgi:predicted metal-dependent peptidase